MRCRAMMVLAAVAAAMLSQGTPAEAQMRPMPAWCAVWFDGCNTCTRDPNGAVGCTKKFCVKPGPARCLQRIAGREPMPRWCAVWFDGCNTCTRAANGALRCTRRACSRPRPARCLRRVGAPR